MPKLRFIQSALLMMVCLGNWQSSNLLSAATIDLFLTAGQSNMVGSHTGNAASLPASALDAQIRYQWDIPGGTGGPSLGATWTTLQPIPGIYASGYFGPEISFARQAAQHGFNPAIYKFSQTGTPITAWGGPGDGLFYDRMVAGLQTAIVDLENEGHTVIPRGLIWIQGESDATASNSTAYQGRLTSLISDLRNDLSAPQLGVVMGLQESHPSYAAARMAEVIAGQQAIADTDTLAIRSSMAGLPFGDQYGHLSPAGIVAHGELLFNDFQLLNFPTNVVSQVPEPSTCLLLCMGMFCFCSGKRKRRFIR